MFTWKSTYRSKSSSINDILILKILVCYISPLLSLAGFVFNMISVTILAKDGFYRPSNVLLFGLVIADTMCLMMTLNYGMIIVFFGPDKLYSGVCLFQYSEGVNYFLTYSMCVLLFLGTWGRCVNTLIPVLITLERILAIFQPLTFKQFVTQKYVIVSVALSFLFWLPWSLFRYVIFTVVQFRMSDTLVVMTIAESQFFAANRDTVTVVEFNVVDVLISWVPIALVSIGSFSVSVRVRWVLSQRRRITSSLNNITWSPRTTRTLMATCFVFVVTHVIGSLLLLLIGSDKLIKSTITFHVVFLLYTINSSCNLFIYIISNRKFQEIFQNLMSGGQMNKPKTQ
ncbi:hypothetical protein Btru_016197 [Bulinus truncatus]|nr:hypothetical protein Btru_016197 [Bulinus truncatus]